METLESLHRKLEGAAALKSIVRTMKALAAANIGQYEMAVDALKDYFHTVRMGMFAYFKSMHFTAIPEPEQIKRIPDDTIGAVVFGSDLGLVGQFNEVLTDFVYQSLSALPGKKQIWAVGERIQQQLVSAGLPVDAVYPVPNSIHAVTPLVGKILLESESRYEQSRLKEFYVFHNQPQASAGYSPLCQRLLPLDEKWRQGLDKLQWPTPQLPQVAGDARATLLVLVHEYLFVSLFSACAESLASENGSRLSAMQRAEKNIDELLDGLGYSYHSLRQRSIDEELFDVISGFEALKNDKSDTSPA